MTNIHQHLNSHYFVTCKFNKPSAFGKQAGFSLIELMIALVISLIILVALGSLYLNITRANTEMAKTNIQIENGRFAMQILQSDLVHAGFWGDYIPDFDNLTFTTIPRRKIVHVLHSFEVENSRRPITILTSNTRT